MKKADQVMHDLSQIRPRFRIRAEAISDILHPAILEKLQNILDYSTGDELAKVREVTITYIKAVSAKGKEFYFPLASRRRGIKYQILSVLVKETSMSIPRWGENGLPISGVKLVDDMIDAQGRVWEQYFEVDQIRPLFTPAKAYLVLGH